MIHGSGDFFFAFFFCVQRFLRSGILAGDGKGNFLAGLHFVLLRRQVGLIVHVCVIASH